MQHTPTARTGEGMTTAQKRARCEEYLLRSAHDFTQAKALAKADGFKAHWTVWVNALGHILQNAGSINA